MVSLFGWGTPIRKQIRSLWTVTVRFNRMHACSGTEPQFLKSTLVFKYCVISEEAVIIYGYVLG